MDDERRKYSWDTNSNTATESDLVGSAQAVARIVRTRGGFVGSRSVGRVVEYRDLKGQACIAAAGRRVVTAAVTVSARYGSVSAIPYVEVVAAVHKWRIAVSFAWQTPSRIGTALKRPEIVPFRVETETVFGAEILVGTADTNKRLCIARKYRRAEFASE